MGRQDSESILAAEINAAAAEHLLRCLEPLGRPVFLATSCQQVLEGLRRQVFRRAAVAAELVLDGELLLARLSRLSVLEHLAALGPGGSADVEKRARRAGARVYVPRPVTTELLSKALRLPLGRRGARPP